MSLPVSPTSSSASLRIPKLSLLVAWSGVVITIGGWVLHRSWTMWPAERVGLTVLFLDSGACVSVVCGADVAFCATRAGAAMGILKDRELWRLPAPGETAP